MVVSTIGVQNMRDSLLNLKFYALDNFSLSNYALIFNQVFDHFNSVNSEILKL